MKNKISLLLAAMVISHLVYSQAERTQLTITGAETTVSQYTDKEVILNGKSDLHITSNTCIGALTNSIVRLNSDDSWLFFDNIRPTVAIDSLLKYVYVGENLAVNGSNVRVAIYNHGVVIMPHAPSFTPLTVYKGQELAGDSASYGLHTYYNSLGAFDNSIRSFRLKRGYMATLANNPDGSGYSRVFIADKEDLVFSELSYLLDETVSFIRVFKHEYVTKKGWCGTGSGGDVDVEKVKGTWWYSWSADRNSKTNQEYVPIKQNLGWPGWSEINNKQNVSHVLGYNEPNRPDQSNMTVEQALAAWPEYMKSGLRIGSPSPSDPFGSNGAWLYEFLDSCKARNYRVDYIVIHAYWAKSPQQWYNDLKYVHDRTGGMPIWITEWNNGANWTNETWPTADRSLSTANAAKQLNDLKAILNVLDTTSFVERYSIYNWVQDARAMLLNGNLTPAGEYYMNNKSRPAFNRKYEKIPTYTLNRNPRLTVSYGATTLSLQVNDGNGDYYRGFILEKKVGDGEFQVILDNDDRNIRNYSEPINVNDGAVKFRVRTKLIDGSMSSYSPEIGMDVATGDKLVQFGKIGVRNLDWNSVFFSQAYDDIPSIVLGAASNNNISALISPRVKFVNKTSRFQIQASAWSYQNLSFLSEDELIPYLVVAPGLHDFGGVSALSGRATANANWTTVTFSTPFETVPVVLANQLIAGTTYATVVRIKDVTTTGFKIKIFKEDGVSSTPGTETISYVAFTQGEGVFPDGRRFKVGKTADNYVGTTAKLITHGDTIANAVFLAQMQSCNDEITAALRLFYLTDKAAYVFKQREKSVNSTAPATESAGWIVIDPERVVQSVDQTSIARLRFSPNPVRDKIYFFDATLEGEAVSIYSLSGSLVKVITPNNGSADLSDLAPGYYLLKTRQYGTTKFVKL